MVVLKYHWRNITLVLQFRCNWRYERALWKLIVVRLVKKIQPFMEP